MKSKRELQLGRAYVPFQPYGRLFPLSEGFSKGTIFPGLYQPYIEMKRYH